MRHLGDKPVAAITMDDVDAFERALRNAGLSPRTRRKYGVLVSMILDYAVATGQIPLSPLAARGRAKRRRKREAAVEVYALEVVESIARAATEPIMGEAIRLAALTGLRQGELLALRWRDVDWTGVKLAVRERYAPMAGETGLDVPKGGRSRTVPLSDQAAVVLDRLSRREAHTRKGDLVLTLDGQHIDPSTLRKAYKVARDAVLAQALEEGDELRALTFHHLRHVFGSRCAAAGVPLATLQAWMGHADISTTMVYVHFQPQAEDAARLTAAFGGPVELVRATGVSESHANAAQG
jgi:integrase